MYELTTLERGLLRDLEGVAERFADEEFSTELYRALAGADWWKDYDGARLSLSWGRAEALVNDARHRYGHEPLALAQTGREGVLSRLVEDELAAIGWHPEARDTRTHDPEHFPLPESPPPKGQGERFAPVEDSHRWEREAHDEADRHDQPVRPTPGPQR